MSFFDDDDPFWKSKKENKNDKDKETKDRPSGKNAKDIPTIYMNKYTTNRREYEDQFDKWILHEAAYIAGVPVFLKTAELGGIQMVPEVYEPPSQKRDSETRLVVKGATPDHYPSKEYRFKNADELDEMWETVQTKTIDDMFEMSRHIWREYIKAKPHVIDLLAATTILSYFQDIYSTVFYIFIVGDNESGKGTILEVASHIVYRAYIAGSASDSVVYRNLGTIEEGQVIMLLDEANRLSPLQIDIAKSGYKKGYFVYRTEDVDAAGGKKPQRFFTFGLKMFAAESEYTGEGAKGLNERCFYINSIKGTPSKTFSKVVSAGNSIQYRKRLHEIRYFRNLMLLYKLKHYHDYFPHFKTTYDGRADELTWVMLSLFHNSTHLPEIINTLDFFIEGRKKKKLESKEALLFDVINRYKDIENLKNIGIESINPDIEEILKLRKNTETFEIPSNIISETFKNESESEWEGYKKEGEPQKKYKMMSNRYGEITVTWIGNTLRDRFGGIPKWIGPKTSRFRIWTFSRETIDGLVAAYSEHTKLKILSVEQTNIEEDYDFKK